MPKKRSLKVYPWSLIYLSFVWTLRLSGCLVKPQWGFLADLVLLFGCGSTPGSWTNECRCHSCQVGHSPSPSWQSPGGILSSCTESPGVRRCHLYMSPAGPQCIRRRTCSPWAPRRFPPHTAAFGFEAPSGVAGYARWVHFHLSFPSHLPCVGWRPRVRAQPVDVLAGRLGRHTVYRWWAMLGEGGQCRC